jgi:hypothetical protein
VRWNESRGRGIAHLVLLRAMTRSLAVVFFLVLTQARAATAPMSGEGIDYPPDAMRCARRLIDDLYVGICHIHKVRLRQRDIPIRDVPDAKVTVIIGYYRIQACRFPHAPLFPSASDATTQWPPPKTQKMYVCSGCRRTQKQWALAHQGNKFADYVLAHATR